VSSLRRWQTVPASTAGEGDPLRARPLRTGKGSISGRLLQASKPEQNRRISSFSRACDLNLFLGQRTDGRDVSPPPPPPPSGPQGRSLNSFQNEMLPCPETRHLEPPFSPQRLGWQATRSVEPNPPKINVLIKPGKRQADYSPAPSQGPAGENKPVLIVLAAPPLPLQSPTRSGKPRRALCSHHCWVNPPWPGKPAHIPAEQKYSPWSQNIPCKHRHPAQHRGRGLSASRCTPLPWGPLCPPATSHWGMQPPSPPPAPSTSSNPIPAY